MAIASLLTAALAACGTTTPEPSPTPTASPTPAPTSAPEALTCDSIVSPDLVAAALVGADEAPVDPVAALNASDVFTTMLLDGVGGLACSWRVGAGIGEYSASADWAYLRIDVLPDAADQWLPLQLGDSRSTETRMVAGIEASVASGDPGWFLSAPVGDTWAVISLSAAGTSGAGGRFLGIDSAPLIDRLAAVGEAVFLSSTPIVGRPDADAAFESFDPGLAPSGTDASAAVRRYHDGPSSPAILVVGDTLYRVAGDGAQTVAEAIVAQS